jgi:hypothetical protein
LNIGRISASEFCRRCAERLGSEEAKVCAIVEDAFSGDHLYQELATYIGSLRPLHGGGLTTTWSFGQSLIRRGIAGLFDQACTSPRTRTASDYALGDRETSFCGMINGEQE